MFPFDRNLGDPLKGVIEKLTGYLKWFCDRLPVMKAQFGSNSRNISLSPSGNETVNELEMLVGSGEKERALTAQKGRGTFDSNARVEMGTAEQQRQLLKILDRALAREMVLEKKMTELRQNEEYLNIRLQQEVLGTEQEAEGVWGRLFEAENHAEILAGVVKEFSQRILTAKSSLESENRNKNFYSSECESLWGKINGVCAELRSCKNEIENYRYTENGLKKRLKWRQNEVRELRQASSNRR